MDVHIISKVVLEPFDTPVVLIFFNRPHLLGQVWAVISELQPSTLIAISDGPKTMEDVALVKQCRSIVQPHWPCEFIEIYRQDNLGLRKSVSTGVSEVFRRFETAIVLEDDCVPGPGFFAYCRELLKRFASDTRIFSIAGTNQFAERYAWRGDRDYSFSRYFNTWGWAAWRRSWELCDWTRMPMWDELSKDINNKGVLGDTDIYWKHLLENRAKLHQLDAWGFQACLTGLSTDQYTVIPRLNMVSNIGLDSGMHFRGKLVSWKLPAAKEMSETLRHPDKIEPDDTHDALFERRHFDPNPVRRVLRRAILGG